MLNVDQLRKTYQKPFLKFMKHIKKANVYYPECTHWYFEDPKDWFLEQDEENGILECCSDFDICNQYDEKEMFNLFKKYYNLGHLKFFYI